MNEINDLMIELGNEILENFGMQWPDAGMGKHCMDCIRFEKYRGNYVCSLPDSETMYCKAHGRPYWSSAYKAKIKKKREREFIKKEEMEI